MNFEEKCLELNATARCKADCCGPTPFPREFIVANYVNIPAGLEYSLKVVPRQEVVIPMTEDDHCIFLNRQSFSCQIYDERPQICREFGNESHRLLSCPHMDSSGKYRLRQQRRNLQRKLKAVFDSFINQTKKLGG